MRSPGARLRKLDAGGLAWKDGDYEDHEDCLGPEEREERSGSGFGEDGVGGGTISWEFTVYT